MHELFPMRHAVVGLAEAGLDWQMAEAVQAVQGNYVKLLRRESNLVLVDSPYLTFVEIIEIDALDVQKHFRRHDEH